MLKVWCEIMPGLKVEFESTQELTVYYDVTGLKLEGGNVSGWEVGESILGM
jgi:hypothetical protein